MEGNEKSYEYANIQVLGFWQEILRWVREMEKENKIEYILILTLSRQKRAITAMNFGVILETDWKPKPGIPDQDPLIWVIVDCIHRNDPLTYKRILATRNSYLHFS